MQTDRFFIRGRQQRIEVQIAPESGCKACSACSGDYEDPEMSAPPPGSGPGSDNQHEEPGSAEGDSRSTLR